MMKVYLFRVSKEQYIEVTAENEKEAYEKVEEECISGYNEEVVDKELIDIYEEDVDAVCDERRLYEENNIISSFYEGEDR